MLLLQCAEQRRLDLNEPVSAWGINLPERTRDGSPGAQPHVAGSFRYDAERFAQLTPVVEECARQPFRKAVALQMIDRLGMAGSVPGRDVARPGAVPGDMLDLAYLEHYRGVLANLAVPYKVDKRGHATRTELPPRGSTPPPGSSRPRAISPSSTSRSTTAFCCARIRCRRPGRQP